MSSNRDFLLPDLGEGLTESELVAWHVVVGDLVELNQPIAEVETAKAIVQLPSPFAGIISRLYVEEGATVAVGAPIVAFELEDGAVGPIERNPVLVGYGPPVEGGAAPKRRRPQRVEPVETSPTISPSPEVVLEEEASTTAIGEAHETPRSTPPVRKLAADLGIDLSTVTGTGEDGIITRADVQAAASGASPMPTSPPPSRASAPAGRETRVPIKGVRKFTAEAMVRSAFTAPHVTEFLTIDVTPTTELLARLRDSKAFAGQKLTLLSVVAKALCIAVGRNPSLNSRWDEEAGEIVQFGYVNLGIAVATPRGLMVPNILDAVSMRARRSSIPARLPFSRWVWCEGRPGSSTAKSPFAT
jgi:2-oxoisovalerate dehydrogenase E2 component (dihydrolipoyl transacylase)